MRETHDNQVTLFEVGPRDGLQNEAGFIATQDKIKLIDLLSQTGLRNIEITSFVSPKWVPQMADAADVAQGIARRDGLSYAALTPNLRGFEAAVAAEVDEVAIFASASESFSQKNINCSIAQSLARFEPILEAAKAQEIKVRGYVSCVIACPYEGEIAPEAVATVSTALLEMGCYEISLGDTIGAGRPASVDRLLGHVTQHCPAQKLAGHFHDTGGGAIANIGAALDHGLRVFDTSIAGLGGCPYAPGAPGNVATEAVATYLQAQGWQTGLDFDALDAARHFAKGLRA